MDPTTVFCPHLECPARGQIGAGTIRIHSRKAQRFLCTECDKTFSAPQGTAVYRLRTAAKTVRLVVTLLAHGRWDHGSWRARPGAAVVPCTAAALDTPQAARPPRACAETPYRAVVLMTTVNCGATPKTQYWKINGL